jgi:hypothetical protein
VALASLAGAAFWARQPLDVNRPPMTAELPVVALSSEDAANAMIEVDLLGVGSRLAKIDNHPRPAPVEPDDPRPVITEPVSTVAFHGVAMVGSRRLALVNVAGKQRFVGVGQTLDGSTVREITPDELILGSDPQRRIPLSERTGGAVTKTIGAANASSLPTGAAMPLGAGRPRRGGWTVPPNISPIEANGWRMLRAQVESDPQYQGFDPGSRDETATKLLENQRETLRARGIIPTRSEGDESRGRP